MKKIEAEVDTTYQLIPMVWTSAKKLINIFTSYRVISLFFHLILIFTLHCQLFLLISGITTYVTKITSQCKILIVPEEGWFGQPKYSTPTKNHSTLCRLLLLFSSIMLPPHQPRVFARLARWQKIDFSLFKFHGQQSGCKRIFGIFISTPHMF